MSLLKQENESGPKHSANRRNALKSTGPRTGEGKRRARLNALKNGQRARTLAGAGLEGGEDAGAYERWRGEFVAPFQAEDALERHLVEELARLGWKRERVERAQAALQEREVEKMELAHLRQLHTLNRMSLDTSDAEIVEHGLLGAKDCTAKFEEALPKLDHIIEQVEKRDWTDNFEVSLQTLYGKQPPWRAGMVLAVYRRLRNGEVTPETPEDAMRAGLLLMLHQERRDLLEQYELLNYEQIEITTPLREACLAPTDPRWPWLLRQEAMLERQIDRRLRLLERLRRGREHHPPTPSSTEEGSKSGTPAVRRTREHHPPAPSSTEEGSKSGTPAVRRAREHHPPAPSSTEEGSKSGTPAVRRAREHHPLTPSSVEEGSKSGMPAVRRAREHHPLTPSSTEEGSKSGTPAVRRTREHQPLTPSSVEKGNKGKMPVVRDTPVGEEKKSTNEANKLLKTNNRVYKRSQTNPTFPGRMRGGDIEGAVPGNHRQHEERSFQYHRAPMIRNSGLDSQ